MMVMVLVVLVVVVLMVVQQHYPLLLPLTLTVTAAAQHSERTAEELETDGQEAKHQHSGNKNAPYDDEDHHPGGQPVILVVRSPVVAAAVGHDGHDVRHLSHRRQFLWRPILFQFASSSVPILCSTAVSGLNGPTAKAQACSPLSCLFGAVQMPLVRLLAYQTVFCRIIFIFSFLPFCRFFASLGVVLADSWRSWWFIFCQFVLL